MTEYKVVKAFTDLKDGNRRYEVGDTYPRNGIRVRQARIEELLGANEDSVAYIAPEKRGLRNDT